MNLPRNEKVSPSVALMAGDGGDEIFGGYPRYEAPLYYLIKIKICTTIFWKVLNPVLKLISEDTSGNHRFRRVKTFVSSLSKPVDEMYEDWVAHFSFKEINLLLQTRLDFDKAVTEVFNSLPSKNLIVKTVYYRFEDLFG